MKTKIYTATVLFVLIFLLRFPAEALAAAREGLHLWLYTLIPTLLPFIILTGFLIHTNGIEKIFSPLKKVWKILFGLSPTGAYAMVTGMLCGYPVGAKTASDLFKYEKIGKRETEYLLTFCNNPSPVFIVTYLGDICLRGSVPISKITGILLFSNCICMLFFRFIIYRNHTCAPMEHTFLKKEASTFRSLGELIDASIMNGFETITRMGGYILIFSILSAMISHYGILDPWVKYMTLCILEITTGLSYVSAWNIHLLAKLAIAIPATAFGGLCILAQTRSVMDGRLSVLPYFSAKCLNAAITAALILIIF